MNKTLSITLSLILLLALLVPAGASASDSGSWGQINQSLARPSDWQRLVANVSGFQLGDVKPLEGSEGLSVGSWGTYPSLDGSTVCVPLAMELARQWLDMEEGDLNGFVNFSTTPYAYDRLTQGKANPLVTIKSQGVMMDDTHPIDLVLGTYPNADERKAAADAGVELVYVPFCYDAFVFMVNDLNPVDSLTVQQIQEIYQGQHKSWADFGGTAQKLYAYQRPHGSGSQTAMEELVMDGLEIENVPENYVSDGMSEAVQQIGNYDNGPGAIGYSYLYYVSTLVESSGIKVLSVDGVAPSPENLQSGAYPFTVNYYAVYRRGDTNTEAFVNWLVSAEGQRAVQQAGYIPLH
jgi:phosphate transport system substrate-binding protein